MKKGEKNMLMKNPDGTWYDDTEYAYNGKEGMITFRITPDNYYKLTKLAHNSEILSLDIGTIINLVIKNFPENIKLKG